MAFRTASNVRRAFSLVEILVVAILIIALAAWLMPKYLSSSKDATGKTVESPMGRAKGVECTNNLSQIRQSLQIVSTMGDSEERPQSLTQLQGIPASMLKCPVGKEDYRFDPQSQKVMCPHPGHESF